MPTKPPAPSLCTDAARDRLPASFRCMHRGFRDADEHAESLQAWDQRYEQLTPGRFAGDLTDTWLDGVQVFRERTNQVVFQAGRSWSGAHTVGLVLSARGDGAFCEQPLTAGNGFVFGDPGEFSLRAPRDFDVIGIAVPAELLRESAGSPGDRLSDALSAAAPTVLPDGAALQALRVFVATYFATVESGDVAPFHQPEVRRGFVSSLLGGMDAAIEGGGGLPVVPPRARNQLVERAKLYVLERRETPVTVSDLCAALGVSRRTLQYCFQEVLGVSPVQFLRAIRLNGVRRDLRRAEGDARVGDIAARWGFWHLSQFAADYRTMFGERPSETVRRGAAGA